MTPVKIVRYGINIGMFGDTRMKGGIEYRYLRHAWPEHFARGPDALDVVGIVQRRKAGARLYAFQHIVGDKHGFREPLAAVDDPVSYGVNWREAPHLGTQHAVEFALAAAQLQVAGP